MAAQCKLYRNTPQLIAPRTWTLVTYERAIRNDRGMEQDLALIVPDRDGDFVWARNIRWEPVTQPEGDVRVRQFMSRFIRDPHGIRDDTGAGDRMDSPGRDWDTTMWPFFGRAGQPVGVEVWHDHHEPAAVGHAQFVGMTWDY
ncbi:hypothetical protein [Streptomyces endophyticus]|uniref:Uncharacterized protein n=1 Tax=Streptomyces endophyticus TaxID=714166 RepID=A0ABU6F3H1_9ACTN|nr:hypothetical protein [Streptomyces endophyticus]MEB8338557.1 hypothetical protein [Streptomyces endophyticus]